MQDPRKRFILLALPLVLLLLVVSQTNLATDDAVFYGLIGFFVVVQLFFVAYLNGKSRQEHISRLIEKQFPDD